MVGATALSSKYTAYQEYKDSGFEWLGAIPESWMITELKRYSSVQGGYAFSSDSFIDAGKAVIRIGDIKQDGSVSLDSCKYINSENPEQYNQYEVRDGDLLMAMTGATIGKAGWYTEKQPALLNQRVGSFKCNGKYLNYRFFWFVLNSSGYQEYIKLTAFGGAQPNISDAGMVGYQSAFPLEDEQQTIANFLDHETAKIDTLIDKQQQLITLLKEKRQAVISHAVTKGLNPNVPMRDSGVEWLGEVPAHWDLSTLKYHVDTVNGFGFSSSDVCEEGVPFIRAGNIKKKSITPTDLYLPQLVVDRYKRVILIEDDIVISMVGSDPKMLESAVGQIGVVPKSMAGAVPNQNVVILREKSNLLLKNFLFYSLCGEAYRNHLNTFSHKLANQSIISSSLIVNAKFILPNTDEQKEIIDFLDQRLKLMDVVVAKNYKSLHLLTERRTALISAAVTGKIDVRNWQATVTSNNHKEVAP